MKKPEVSVIMATYNMEKYIEESIKSILEQTFSNFELIIVNDASKDNTLSIIRRYQKIDERIRLFNNSENIGPAASRNRGLEIAKGKYIAILDADDISLPTRIEKQYQFLEEHADIFLCGTGILCIDENGNIIDTPKTIVGHEKIGKMLIQINCIAHSSIMFKKGNIFYREKFAYAHDYDLYLILLSKGLKLENLENVLVKYRSTAGNISFSKRKKQDLFAKKAKEFYKQRLKTGRDEYEYFDSSKILVTKDIDPRNVDTKKGLLKHKIGICLLNRDFNNANMFLSQYKKINNTCLIESVPYALVIKYPYIYELYRNVRYSFEKRSN